MSRHLFLLLLLVSGSALAADCPWYFRMLASVGIWRPQPVTLSTGIRVEPKFNSDYSHLDTVKVTDERGHEVLYERTNRDLQELKREGFYPPEFLDPSRLKNGKVLDVGTGNGQFVFDLWGAGVQAEGLDIFLTPRQIRSGFFRQADVRDSGYKDGEFQTIYATETILSYPNAVAAPQRAAYLRSVLGELRRVLKPDGVVRVSTIEMPLHTVNGAEVLDVAALEARFAGTGMRVKSYPKQLNVRQGRARSWIELEKAP